MKANEAPEKIYISPLPNHSDGYVGVAWDEPHKTMVEYTNTDAFIEKALKWYCLDCECNDSCKADHKCFFKQEYKRYLEGNENAIPPKSENAINPDGSTTENYRYRHFIRRMQDAFIEKACKWLEDNIGECCDGENIEFTATHVFNIDIFHQEEFIEQFKTAMKGE